MFQDHGTGALVISSLLDFLTFALCAPYSETTEGQQFDMLLEMVASNGRTLFKLFQVRAYTFHQVTTSLREPLFGQFVFKIIYVCFCGNLNKYSLVCYHIRIFHWFLGVSRRTLLTAFDQCLILLPFFSILKVVKNWFFSRGQLKVLFSL